jgi:hypothetical protein
MIRHTHLFVGLVAALFLSIPLVSTVSAGRVSDDKEEFQATLSAFHKASATGTLAERTEALEALVSLGDPAALETLAGEIGRVSSSLRGDRDEVYRVRYQLERKRAFLDQLKLRLARDPSLEQSYQNQKTKLNSLETQLRNLKAAVKELSPWYLALGEASATFAASLRSGPRKKLEKTIWKDIEDANRLSSRLAGVEILGHIGSPGTAVSLQKLIVDLSKERSTLEHRLPKLMGDVRKLEKRIQAEQVQLEGRSSMMEQYNRAKKEAAAMQKAITSLAHLGDAASEAGGVALTREEGAVLDKSIQTLLRAQRKAKHGARRRTLAMLGSARIESVQARLLELLEAEKEAAARATLIDTLATGEYPPFAGILLDKLILDPSWHVKSRAAAAMATMRLERAIPILIDRLEVEEGRLKTDYQEALISLTGENFNTNVTLWRRWWEENGAGFEVPPIDEIDRKVNAEAKARVGTTFFGISTESQRVLFVLDLSGSMAFSMVPRNNPEDDPRRPHDMPRNGEHSRLDEAKLALAKAIGGTDEGSTFNVIFYASDVWSWQDNLVEMTTETRSDALRMIEELSCVGGTNIYGALAVALEMAGAESGDEWSEPEIDTIFFLSDGRASVGLTTDPDDILGFVKDLNASSGIVIHTIGLSGAQDAYLLRSLAEENGGKYVAR